jgi:hypothetical protein
MNYSRGEWGALVAVLDTGRVVELMFTKDGPGDRWEDVGPPLPGTESWFVVNAEQQEE